MNKLTTFALSALSFAMVNGLMGCDTGDDRNTLPANHQDTASVVKHTDSTIISEDSHHNTVHALKSFRLDSAQALVIFNGRDIYQVDPMEYQVAGYWLQMTEEMDLKTNHMVVTGAVVSKISDDNNDGYISADDVVKYPDNWKQHSHAEYRLKGRKEFDANNRTKLWRVAPVPRLENK